MPEKPTYKELEQRILELEKAESERKTAEYTQRECEESNRATIHKIQAAVVVHGADTQIIACNSKAQELLGLTENQMLGKTAIDPDWKFLAIDGEKLPDSEFPVAQVMASRQPLRDFTAGIYRPSKLDRVWVVVNADPVFDKNENIRQVIVTFMDITIHKQTEEALRKSEALLTAAGQMAKVGGWEVDAKTLAVSWTEETYRIYELPLSKRPPMEEAINFFHPDDRPKLETAIQKALDHGEPYDMEIRFITAKGNHLWTHTICKPVTIDGKTIKLFGTFQDITDRKQAEETLRESEQRFRDLTESTSDWMWEVDRKGVYTYSSPKVTELLGYKPEEVLGKKPFNFMSTEEAKQVSDKFNRFLSLQEPFDSLENTHLHKNGYPVVMETSGVPIFDTEGEFKGYRGIDRDITERKRAEEAFQFTKFAIDRFSDAAFWMGDDARFVYVNKATCRSLGYSQEELLNMTVHDIDPDFPQEVWSEHWAELKSKGSMTIESHHRTKDGLIFPVEITLNHVEFGGKEYNCAFAKDISNRKQIEEERRKLELQLQQSQKMEAVATLAGGIAHQFNNALSGITISLDLLELDLPDDENFTGYMEQMRHASHRMTQLTSQLLAYARGGKYQAKIISPSTFVRDTLPLIGHRIHSGVSVDTNLPRDILSMKADLIQMQMVLSAVLQNASEAIEDEGRIQISSNNEKIEASSADNYPGFNPGSYVSLTVVDDGKGMDEGTRNRIFEPFFTTKIQGRGLGMAAVYGIVKNHDGYILAESELGKGTTVRILLPAIEEDVKKTKKPRIKPIKGTGTVLVIEDEEMLMNATHAILEKLGYHVLEARLGKDAIAIAKTFDGDIDLAILDIVLPDIDGKAIYPFLMEARPKMKVIVCSGYAREDQAQEILDKGAHDFVQKPFTIGTLSEKIRKVLDRK